MVFCKHATEFLFRNKQEISQLGEKFSASQKGLDFSGFDVGYCVNTISHNHHLRQSFSSAALKSKFLSICSECCYPVSLVQLTHFCIVHLILYVYLFKSRIIRFGL